MSPLSPLCPCLCYAGSLDSPTVFLARRKQKKMLSAIALSSLFPSNVFKNKQANKQTTQNSTKQSKTHRWLPSRKIKVTSIYFAMPADWPGCPTMAGDPATTLMWKDRGGWPLCGPNENSVKGHGFNKPPQWELPKTLTLQHPVLTPDHDSTIRAVGHTQA